MMKANDDLSNFIRNGVDAQRDVDRIIEEAHSKNKASAVSQDPSANRIVKKKDLKDSVDVHWRTDKDGYEYIMRTIHEMAGIGSLAEAERKLWFTRGWRERFEKMRARHRKSGIPDSKFLPVSHRK